MVPNLRLRIQSKNNYRLHKWILPIVVCNQLLILANATDFFYFGCYENWDLWEVTIDIIKFAADDYTFQFLNISFI